MHEGTELFDSYQMAAEKRGTEARNHLVGAIFVVLLSRSGQASGRLSWRGRRSPGRGRPGMFCLLRGSQQRGIRH